MRKAGLRRHTGDHDDRDAARLLLELKLTEDRAALGHAVHHEPEDDQIRDARAWPSLPRAACRWRPAPRTPSPRALLADATNCGSSLTMRTFLPCASVLVASGRSECVLPRRLLVRARQSQPVPPEPASRGGLSAMYPARMSCTSCGWTFACTSSSIIITGAWPHAPRHRAESLTVKISRRRLARLDVKLPADLVEHRLRSPRTKQAVPGRR
jgi:hypothetical protein